MSRVGWIGSIVLLLSVAGVAALLASWKHNSMKEAHAASLNQPEQMESVTMAVAKEREYRRTTVAIGTVLALRSITLRNELAGTVHQVTLTPGQIVEEGTVLVALDVGVEEAELKALEAQAAMAESMLGRTQRAGLGRGAAESEVDRARMDRDVALANIARTKAIIARKTLRAPFRARIGMSDVHVGQYLKEGTELTTLQGVDDAVHVDFPVAQPVAEGLRAGSRVDLSATRDEAASVEATIVAVDARIDPATRNAWVRARVDGADKVPAPGASVRVRVPVGAMQKAVAVPVSALRKGPAGDHVFVITPDQTGKLRAYLRKVVSGTILGDEILVHTGLAAGEQVAASGSFKLREAVLVAVADGSAPAGGKPQ